LERDLTTSDRKAFIIANTRRLAPPLVPEIVLYLADEVTSLWQMTEDELAKSNLPPPFWAFAWAGGQALARYILDQPQIVAQKRVLDFASGSGLVAIAAMKAGARVAEANEIDDFALSAIALNAAENSVDISARAGDLIGTDEGWDVVLAGDVSYERYMAARVTDWLVTLVGRGATVLVGDPGRTYLARDKLTMLATYDVPVPKTIETVSMKQGSVWGVR
jgi:predicted nicotinamide N-methyase